MNMLAVLKNLVDNQLPGASVQEVAMQAQALLPLTSGAASHAGSHQLDLMDVARKISQKLHEMQSIDQTLATSLLTVLFNVKDQLNVAAQGSQVQSITHVFRQPQTLHVFSISRQLIDP